MLIHITDRIKFLREICNFATKKENLKLHKMKRASHEVFDNVYLRTY